MAVTRRGWTPIQPLTDGERRALRAYVEGETHVKAAQSLGISVQTLKNHLGNIYKKVGARKAHSAVYRLAIECGCDPLGSQKDQPKQNEPSGAMGGPIGQVGEVLGKFRETPVRGNILMQQGEDSSVGALVREDSVPDTAHLPPILERDPE